VPVTTEEVQELFNGSSPFEVVDEDTTLTSVPVPPARCSLTVTLVVGDSSVVVCDEVEAPLFVYLFADSTANSDFVIIKLPNIKINSAEKSSDGTAISLSSNFSAGVLLDGSTTQEQTTIVIVDSSVA